MTVAGGTRSRKAGLAAGPDGAAAAKGRRPAKARKSSRPAAGAPEDGPIGPGERYVLRLYVAGLTPRSRSAIANLRSICDEYLKGRCDLEVVDVFKRPVLAREEQIFATPTLVKRVPAPLRRFIGDLSEREKVLIGLDLVRRQG